MRRARLAIGAFALAALVGSQPALAKGKLNSSWLDREISIDGELDEWREQFVYISGVDAFIAAFNDDRFLYLCLYSQSPEVARQIATDGLRVRIEIKRLGEFVVHYPSGSGLERGSIPSAASATNGPSVDVIELSLPGTRDRVAVSSDGRVGIAASVSQRGSFVYELKLPLQKDESTPWALNLFPGDRAKLIIESPLIDGLAQKQATRDGRPNSSSFGNAGSSGLYGPGSDPNWTGGLGSAELFYPSDFIFLLKTRLELATSP